MNTKKSRKVKLTRKERLELFAEAKPNHPAVLFNKAAAEAGMPLAHLADVGGVSKYSLYVWVSGLVEPTPRKATILRRLTKALVAAVEAGDLPTMDKDADTVQLLRRHL